MAHRDDIPFVLTGADGTWMSVKMAGQNYTGAEAREIQKELGAKGNAGKLDSRACQAIAVNDPRIPFQPGADRPWLPLLGSQSDEEAITTDIPITHSIYENGDETPIFVTRKGKGKKHKRKSKKGKR